MTNQADSHLTPAPENLGAFVQRGGEVILSGEGGNFLIGPLDDDQRPSRAGRFIGAAIAG